MYKQLIEAVSILRKTKAKIDLITNGELLTKQKVNELFLAGLDILTISLYEEQYIDADVEENYNNQLSRDKNKQALDLINQEKILKEFYEVLKNVPYDSKSDAFLELLDQIYSQNPHEKILIFTKFVDTLNKIKYRQID